MEEENVKVIVRIRPIQTMERKNGDISCVKAAADGREVQVKVGPLDAQVYKCNKCFSTDASQAEFFEESGISELLDSAIQGYRACAFAFGQTGAGKTFTMVGPTRGINHRDKQVGMIARSLEYAFNKLNMMGVKYSIKIACLEIYHEHVYDLFAEEKERLSLAVREHATDGFFLEGCKMVECVDYEIACGALDLAMRNRQTGGHDMNNRSSRSHCLTEIYIETPGGEGEEFVSRGRMSLVDLAGSERLKSTNSTGKVLQEAGFINRSLYVLGKVIAGLVRTNGDLNHKDVPFRDSKLTKLLISSLSGKCHTLLISCVSEAKGSQAETLRTLKFSMSCARIRNKPVKFLDPHDRLILDLRDEIKRLRHENKKLRSTMLTAPASPEKGSHFSDDEASGQHRALSAHSSLIARKTNRRVTSRSPVKKLKKAAASPHKMRSSQSEFFAEYGARIKSLSPAKHAAARRSASNVERTTLPIYEQAEDDALSYMDQGFEDDSHSRVNGSQSSPNTKKKVSQAEMDDIVRRHAVGPMVFRGKEDIRPVRDSHQSVHSLANNFERTIEADRLAQLERRLAKMERAEAMRNSGGSASLFSDDHSVEVPQHHETAIAPEALHSEVHPDNHPLHGHIVVSASALLPPKKPKRKKPAPKKEKKESPYIAHLKNAPPEKPSRASLPEIRRAAPKTVVSSHTDANDVSDDTKKVKGATKKEIKVVAEAAEASKSEHQSASVTSLHDSIQAELEALGLADPPGGRALPPKPKKALKSHAQKTGDLAADKRTGNVTVSKAESTAAKSTNKNHSERILPVIKPGRPSSERKASESAVASKKTEKLPDIANQQQQKPHEARVASPVKVGAKPSSSPSRVKESPKNKSPVPSPAVALVKKKLEVLERSLTAQQIEMEDNPGEATTEREERLVAMRLEAKDMRKELEIAAGTALFNEYDEDGFDEFEPDDQEEGSNPAGDSRGRKEEADAMDESQGPPTPVAVKQMALAMREINESSVAEAQQNRSGVSTAQRQSSASRGRPRTAPGDNDEYGYGDEDFEAEFDDAVESASSKRLFEEKEEKAAAKSSNTAAEEDTVTTLTANRSPSRDPENHTATIANKSSSEPVLQVAAVESKESASPSNKPHQSPLPNMPSPTPSYKGSPEPPQQQSASSLNASKAEEQEEQAVAGEDNEYEDEFDAEEEQQETEREVEGKTTEEAIDDNKQDEEEPQPQQSPLRNAEVSLSADEESAKESLKKSPKESVKVETAVAGPVSSNQQEDEEKDSNNRSEVAPVAASEEEGDGYGAEDFDEYEVSFEA